MECVYKNICMHIEKCSFTKVYLQWESWHCGAPRVFLALCSFCFVGGGVEERKRDVGFCVGLGFTIFSWWQRWLRRMVVALMADGLRDLPISLLHLVFFILSGIYRRGKVWGDCCQLPVHGFKERSSQFCSLLIMIPVLKL